MRKVIAALGLATLLGSVAMAPAGAAAPAAAKAAEAHVEQTVTEFLEWDGWRAIRTHPLPPIVQRLDAIMAKAPEVLKGHWLMIRSYIANHTHKERFGEAGMPDKLFLRYAAYAGDLGARLFPKMTEEMRQSEVEVMWIEFKKPGERPRPEQIAWHEAERRRGALVKVVDDIDDFMLNWYPKSGLQRRIPPKPR
jgi:hypothetical protein